MQRLLLPALVFTFAVSGTAQSLRPGLESLAIVGATVVTSPGSSHLNYTVVVANGVIKAVGPTETVPPGAKIVDGKGLVVYAGFIDGGTTKGLRAAPVTVRRDEPFDPSTGFLTSMPTSPSSVHPSLSALDLFDPDDPNWKAQRSAGFTTAMVYPSAGIIKGTGALINIDGRARRQAVVKDSVCWAMAFNGAGDGYPGTTLGAFATIRQSMSDAAWQASITRQYEQGGHQRPPFDPELAALRTLMAEKTPALMEADEAWRISQASALASETGIEPLIFGASEGFRRPESLRGKNVVVSVAFSAEPNESKTKEGELEEPSPKKAERQRLWLERVNNTKLLLASGAKVGWTTSGCKDFDTFFANLRRMVKEGLSKDDALAGLTTAPAEFYGVARHLGKIEVGMTANLTIMSGDFLDEKSKLKFLVVDGILIDPSRDPMKFDNTVQDNDKGGLK